MFTDELLNKKRHNVVSYYEFVLYNKFLSIKF